MPNTRRKAADFFPSESGTEKPETIDASPEKPTASAGGRTHELRRSARLHSSPAADSSTQPKPQRKFVLELGQEAKKVAGRAVERANTPRSGKSKAGKGSSASQDTEEVYEDAREEQFATPSMKSRMEVSVTSKSPATDEPYMSALEDIEDTTIREERVDEIPSTVNDDGDILKDLQHVPTTQNTLDNIPSSQPRPRSEHSPVPLLPVPSSPPAASLPSTTTFTDIKSTQETFHIPEPPPQAYDADADADESFEGSESDDEAPEAISLSTSRSQAMESQSKISQAAKAKAEKAREKRRHRDTLLASQKQSKRAKTQHEIEIPNSQQSATDINSGNTTDTPAPNQAHQAARVARQAMALPTEILQAASATWLQPDPPSTEKSATHRPKKRKERDDGIRILENMNASLAPAAGKIGVTKEKMIMRMGRGERRMFIGRFAR